MGRKLVVELIGDSSSIEKAFKRAGTSGSTLEGKLVDVGKKAALALGALGVAGAGVGAKMIKMAADAEEVRSKFNTVFGAEMPGMIKQLDAFSEATGASRYQLREQAADLGALLVPLVGSQKEAGNLSVSFTKLATDLSSFNNVPVGEALEAIRSGLVGEAEPLRRFGVLLNEASVKAEAYSSGIAKAGSVLTEQQKVQARANLIMEQTTLAQGDATRTADSFTNQMRRLQNQVSDTATSMGEKLLPIATSVLAHLNEWGPAIAQKVQPHLDKLGQWASDHEQEFRQLFENIKGGAEDAGVALIGVGKGADETAKVMGGWDSAFSMILSGLLATKFAAVGKLIGGAGGMLPMLTKVKALGPTIAIAVVVDLLINEDHRKKLADIAELLSEKVGLDDPRWFPILGIFSSAPRKRQPGQAGVGSLPGLLGSGATTTKAGTQLPTSFKSTHQTSGLPGFPAVDIFAQAGTPILAPENGRIVSIRPFNTDPDFYGMAIYYLGASGTTYYIKHIYDPSPRGPYKKGEVLGKVAAGTTGGPHVHLGKREGPGVPIPISTGGGGGGGGGGTGGGTGAVAGATGGTPPKAVVQPLIPAKMRLALTKAEGTPNIGDDLTALRAMVAYLEKLLPKTKDIEKRVEITEALNSLRARIKEITAEGKKQNIADAFDFEQMKVKLRESFREGIEQARQKIADARGGFNTAFEGLVGSLLQVFDAKTEQMLANLRTKVQGFDFEIGRGELTPTEKLLQDMDKAAAEKARTDAVVRAESALTKAMLIEDAEERAVAVAAAEKELHDARNAVTRAGLEELAAQERAAAEASLAAAAQKIVDDQAIKKAGFVTELANLQTHWNDVNANTETRTQELQALMAKYDVPFDQVGQLLGTAFATGFINSLNIVFQTLQKLEQAINSVTPAQAAEAVILAGGTALEARSAALNAKYKLGNIPTYQHGGVVPGTGPQFAIVHGGEHIIPKGRVGGSVVYNFNFPSYIGDKQELMTLVRNEAAKFERQNGRNAF